VHVIEAIQERRSVKHFDANHQMTAAEERKLIELAMLSPTAFHLQNWRFVLVKDPALRKAIRAQAWDQEQVTDASLLVVLCADLHAWNKNAEQYWTHASKEVQEMIVPSIVPYYQQKPVVQRDEAMRSCGLAAQTLMLAAKSMGYDSCPMDGFDFDAVGRLINLPKDHVLTMFVAIGKATQQPWSRGSHLPFESVVIVDRFQTADEKDVQTKQPDVEKFQPGVYRHYKGAHYLAIGLAREDASNEPVVVYTRLYERDGLPLSTRTLKAWNESVTVDEACVKRFTYVGQTSS
jgi:nitroreductase